MSRFILVVLALFMMGFGSLGAAGCTGATETAKKEPEKKGEIRLIRKKKTLKKFKGGRMEAADDDE